MAPSRRKGANKAAAAAAARRQWKVGDLVLAKVKGFPAWPATVSEPEKWGYATDWKKVLVYFFGTQQIAFCNPADVEAFTEEKKESLLGRRHGKGSDFVRAVHEIIESYEKLKRQDQVNNANTTVDGTLASENNSGELSIKSYANGEAAGTTFHLCQKKTHSTAEEGDVGVKSKSGTAVNGQEDLPDRGMPEKEVVTEMAWANTDSYRKIVESNRSQKCFTRRRPPSARRARSRADSSKVKNFITHSGVTDSVFRDGSGRRNKRIRKSPDVLTGHDMDLHDLISNCSIEGNDSEILTADSDSLSLNEGSTVESECKDTHPDSVIELAQRNVENQRLDFQRNGIHKKRRMPNRKRPNSEVVEFNARPDEKVDSVADLVKGERILPGDQERSTERFPKEDGDEHLPLVKRARVRMGRASSTGCEPETSLDTEEKRPDVCNSLSDHIHVSSDREGDGSTDQNPSTVKGDVENSPPLNNSHAMKCDLWEVRKNQHFGSSLDGEAALPPSKRLHRALEAMSANAAEDNQIASDGPSTTNADTNGFSSSSDDHAKFSLERQSVSQFGVSLAEENLSNNDSRDGVSEFSVQSDLPIEQVRICSGVVAIRSSDDSSKSKSCKDDVDYSDGKNLLESSSGDLIDAALILECPKSLSTKEAHVSTNGSLDAVLPLKGGCTNGKTDLGKSPETLDDKTSLLSSNLLAAEDATIQLPHSATNMQTDNADAKFDETMKSCQFILEDKKQVNELLKDVGATGPTIRDCDSMLSPAHMDVMTNGKEDQDHSHSNSISDDHSGDKTVSVTQSSSSLTDGLDFILRATPHNSTSNAPVSVNNSIQVNGSCSPAVHSHHETQKFAERWNYKEANVALTSFESILGLLTRTKESIGRATRSAIECAKFGVAAKVVEILARSLERESSLHRRVDLFFLVDSIAQCSRGLKGDVGGIYPSAILAVLPRLLSAAAPPGSSSQENRRQCLKVLRVWQERRILPESIVRHHIRELDSLCGSSCSRAFSRRPLRNERAFDDPIREMEGMNVDEYGSNSSIQLPGFCMPPMLRDEDDGSDSDGESFEAVTPERDTEKSEGNLKPVPVVEKHRHILEDVDGELEMEDVAPSSDAVVSTSHSAGTDILHASHHSIGNPASVVFAPPLPKDVPPMSPPLPVSPPPPPPPLLPVPRASLPLPSERPDCIASSLNSKLFTCSQNIEDDLQKSTADQSIAPGVNLLTSETAQCSSHGHIDFHSQVPKQIPNSTNCSFSSPPVSHPPVRTVNNPPADGAFNKGFHLRPPHPAPSNQFSYMQVDHRAQSRRDIPPASHPTRFHLQNTDNGNFYRDCDRMKLAPHDIGERWRAPPPFPGPRYLEGSRMPYAPAPFSSQLGEAAPPSNHWAFPPRAMNHMPHRPPSGGPIPVAARGPNCWRPR
ncbi:protein HUA2-LIKE 2-like isoform X1 [Coffea arabica]|uniref:Protein HUA2-LIKE 2-like isoform X1 n=1 Tax=Coffea arabica TaxID=13443 RepID=A0A6P6WK42_COFAR|nr:protein HUA2-LIKE 2-like isoform X1 [Coffea arabica]